MFRSTWLLGSILCVLLAWSPEVTAVDFAALGCGQEGEQACSVAPAAYVGKKPSGCPGRSFFDPIDGGTCWRCPSGTVRGVTSVKSSSACVRGPREVTRRATRHGRGTGLLGTDCPGGQFWDPNGYCWSCPSGYTRTAAPVTRSNACTRWIGPSATRSTLVKRLACPSGSFFDLIRGGSCWSCPDGYVRTLASVEADNACAVNLVAGITPVLGMCADDLVNIRGRCEVRGRCGGEGQRPCLIVERLPSCDPGLAEDFIENRCVEDRLAETVCRGLVNAVWAAQDLSAVLSQLPKPSDVGGLVAERLGVNPAGEVEALRDEASARLMGEIESIAPEAAEIARWMGDVANLDTLRRLFSAETVCDGSMAGFDRELKALGLVPKSVLARIEGERTAAAGERSSFSSTGLVWGPSAESAPQPRGTNLIPRGDPTDEHFYMGYQIGVAGAKGVGGGVSLIGVTDLRGNGGLYVAPAAQVVSNVGGGVDARVLVFTTGSMPTFEGWGFGLGATVDVKEYASLGLDLIADSTVTVRGFGVGGGIGYTKAPFDVGVSASYAFALNRRCANLANGAACHACTCLD